MLRLSPQHIRFQDTLLITLLISVMKCLTESSIKEEGIVLIGCQQESSAGTAAGGFMRAKSWSNLLRFPKPRSREIQSWTGDLAVHSKDIYFPSLDSTPQKVEPLQILSTNGDQVSVRDVSHPNNNMRTYLNHGRSHFCSLLKQKS